MRPASLVLNKDDLRMAAAFDHAVELLPEPERTDVANAAEMFGVNQAFVVDFRGRLAIDISVDLGEGFVPFMRITDARQVGYDLGPDGEPMYVG